MSLEKIGRGNKTAIAALVKLIRNSQFEHTRLQAAQSLEFIEPGNQEAINALVELIRNTQYEEIRWRATSSLKKIGRGNDTAIAALIELTGNSHSEKIRTSAAEGLGTIDPGNNIGNCQDDNVRRSVAWSLGKIDPGNQRAIDTLIELIRNTQSEDTRGRAISTLENIATKPQIPTVMNTLKDYLSNETCKNDCYNILWKYAEALPYKKFHQAWYGPQQLDNIPATTTQKQQLTNICTQLQHRALWCIDAKNFAGVTDEPQLAKAFRNQIYKQIRLRDKTMPPVAEIFEREAYIIQLKERLQTPKILLLLHNCEPEDALEQFCRRLAEELDIAWITDAPLEPPMRAFSPGQANLVGAVESWLEELMLGNGE